MLCQEQAANQKLLLKFETNENCVNSSYKSFAKGLN